MEWEGPDAAVALGSEGGVRDAAVLVVLHGDAAPMVNDVAHVDVGGVAHQHDLALA